MRIPSLLLAFAVAAQSIPAAAQTRHRRSRIVTPPADTSKIKLGQTAWSGTYTFREGGGRAGAFVEHTIRVYRQGDALVADIDADGFQTSRRLRCGTKAEGDKLSLYFQRYREDNVFEPYEQGQFLLALERSSAGGRPRILTHWGAYRPALGSARDGVYFKKTS